MTTTDSTPETPAEAPAADQADGLLFKLAESLADISSRIPAGLWYRVHLHDLPASDMAPFIPDIELKARGGENARLLAEALPWAGQVSSFVQPGTEYDHWTWQGVLGDFRVRVVGMEPLGGGPLCACCTPARSVYEDGHPAAEVPPGGERS